MNMTARFVATAIACLAFAGTSIASTKTTYRDSMGRLQGSRTTR